MIWCAETVDFLISCFSPHVYSRLSWPSIYWNRNKHCISIISFSSSVKPHINQRRLYSNFKLLISHHLPATGNSNENMTPPTACFTRFSLILMVMIIGCKREEKSKRLASQQSPRLKLNLFIFLFLILSYMTYFLFSLNEKPVSNMKFDTLFSSLVMWLTEVVFKFHLLSQSFFFIFHLHDSFFRSYKTSSFMHASFTLIRRYIVDRCWTLQD